MNFNMNYQLWYYTYHHLHPCISADVLNVPSLLSIIVKHGFPPTIL